MPLTYRWEEQHPVIQRKRSVRFCHAAVVRPLIRTMLLILQIVHVCRRCFPWHAPTKHRAIVIETAEILPLEDSALVRYQTDISRRIVREVRMHVCVRDRMEGIAIGVFRAAMGVYHGDVQLHLRTDPSTQQLTDEGTDGKSQLSQRKVIATHRSMAVQWLHCQQTRLPFLSSTQTPPDP